MRDEPRRSSSRSDGPAHDLHWDIKAIVAELRELRQASLAARIGWISRPSSPRARRWPALSRTSITALFPNRLASHALDGESVDYFVGHTLDRALRDLVGPGAARDSIRGRRRRGKRRTARTGPGDRQRFCRRNCQRIRAIARNRYHGRLRRRPRCPQRGRDPGLLSRYHGHCPLPAGPHAVWPRRACSWRGSLPRSPIR